MTDQYEELIKSVKILKENQAKRESKINEIASNYKNKKEQIDTHYQKISSLLADLETEINAIENKKSELISSFSSIAEEIPKKEETLPYKKFYIRESLFTKLLRKTNYQTLYNMTLSFLILNGLIYILNIYNNVSSNPFQKESLSLYISGFFLFVKFSTFKHILGLLLIIFINCTSRRMSLLIVPSLLIGIVLFILFNEKVFPTSTFSSMIKGLHYWDNITFILKILAYFFEKKLCITYLNYCKTKGINPEIKNSTIIIKDNGENDEIIFEFKRFNPLKECLHYWKFYLLPTFIYRDQYPKSSSKSTSAIFIHLINCALCFIFLFVGVEVCLIPLLRANLVDLSFEKLTNLFVSFILYSVCGLFVVIFGFSHSYSNFTAELFNFGDKQFYDDFYNAEDPKTFIEKLSYIYTDFCRYYIYSIVYNLFLTKKSEIIKEISKNILSIIFLCVIVDYVVYACIHTNSPIISMCLTFTFFASFPMKMIKGDSRLVVNWLFLTSGLGFIAMILGSEMYLSWSGIKFDKLGYIERHSPKIYNLFMHPDRVIGK